MQPYTPADYTSDGNVHALSDLTGHNSCRWFQVVGTSISGNAARVGDSSVNLGGGSPATTAAGFPVGSGGAQFAPPVSMFTEPYDLTKWFVVATSGDVLSIGVVI